MSRAWDAFWFRPAPPHNLIAARIIVALTTLWLVLSRPLLPDVVRWPAPFWKHADIFIRVRFGIMPLPFAVEMTLYVLLALSLLATAAGVFTRLAAFTSAILVYHFAPFEDILVSTGGPFFRGFTAPLLALLVIAFANSPQKRSEPSAEFRWPVALIQLIFALTYLLSGISKLRLAGLAWATRGTFESIVLSMMIPDSVPPWSHYFVGNPMLGWAGAFVGVAMDFLFIVAVFSRRAARVIVPLAFVAHIAIIEVLGVVFLDMPMLLLFVNWEWLTSKLRRPGSARSEIAVRA